jgi:hypothetical protein
MQPITRALKVTCLLTGIVPAAIPFAHATNVLSGPAAGWSQFTDPTENAFKISVPHGWLVKGGVERRSRAIATIWVAVSSPDGSTTAFINDPAVPTFALPTPTYPIGTFAPSLAGPQAVLPYQDGSQFAAQYGNRAFGLACGHLQAAGTQAEPEFGRQAEAFTRAAWAKIGVNASIHTVFDGGAASFTCEIKGRPFKAKAIAVTALSQFGNAGVWVVPQGFLIGYKTPATQQSETDAIVRRMRDSLQKSPQWDAKMVAAGRQEIARINAAGVEGIREINEQAARFSAQTRQNLDAAGRARTANHNAFMTMMDVQQNDRDNAFDDHMRQKSIGQFNEMLYIQNRRCAIYDHDDPQICRVTVDN